jgi:hypothetical protein
MGRGRCVCWCNQCGILRILCACLHSAGSCCALLLPLFLTHTTVFAFCTASYVNHTRTPAYIGGIGQLGRVFSIFYKKDTITVQGTQYCISFHPHQSIFACVCHLCKVSFNKFTFYYSITAGRCQMRMTTNLILCSNIELTAAGCCWWSPMIDIIKPSNCGCLLGAAGCSEELLSPTLSLILVTTS